MNDILSDCIKKDSEDLRECGLVGLLHPTTCYTKDTIKFTKPYTFIFDITLINSVKI